MLPSLTRLFALAFMFWHSHQGATHDFGYDYSILNAASPNPLSPIHTVV